MDIFDVGVFETIIKVSLFDVVLIGYSLVLVDQRWLGCRNADSQASLRLQYGLLLQ